jgi:hypothetical protein
VRTSASRTAQSATSTFSATREAAAARFAASSDVQDARLGQLERLVQLREAGILDDEELRAEKARILQADGDGVATSS